MIIIKKKKFLYKKFIRLKENVLNRKKILKFTKHKWERLIQTYKKKLKKYRIYKPQDQNKCIVSKYSSRKTSYEKRFQNILHSTQRFKMFYGDLSHKYFRKQIKIVYSKVQKNKNINSEFLEKFETRLDVTLLRAKFSSSMQNAKQLISHGKIFVNKTKVKNKSYILKFGDLITVEPKYSKLIEFNIKQSFMWPIPPKHLTINYQTMQIIFQNIKNTNLSICYPLNFNLEQIIEYNRM